MREHEREAPSRRIASALRQAIEAGDSNAAQEALREAESSIRKAVSKGVFHHKTGSRYVSRLTLAANAKQTAAA